MLSRFDPENHRVIVTPLKTPFLQLLAMFTNHRWHVHLKIHICMLILCKVSINTRVRIRTNHIHHGYWEVVCLFPLGHNGHFSKLHKQVIKIPEGHMKSPYSPPQDRLVHSPLLCDKEFHSTLSDFSYDAWTGLTHNSHHGNKRQIIKLEEKNLGMTEREREKEGRRDRAKQRSRQKTKRGSSPWAAAHLVTMCGWDWVLMMVFLNSPQLARPRARPSLQDLKGGGMDWAKGVVGGRAKLPHHDGNQPFRKITPWKQRRDLLWLRLQALKRIKELWELWKMWRAHASKKKGYWTVTFCVDELAASSIPFGHIFHQEMCI